MRTDVRTLVESEWLGQWDLQNEDGSYRDAVVEIASVDPYRPRERKKKKNPDGTFSTESFNKLMIGFKGKRKKWIAGPRSWKEVLIPMLGRFKEEWIGKRITIYVDPKVTMGRKVTGGLRVRPMVSHDELDEDPLDNEVDEERQAMIDEAKEQASGV